MQRKASVKVRNAFVDVEGSNANGVVQRALLSLKIQSCIVHTLIAIRKLFYILYKNY